MAESTGVISVGGTVGPADELEGLRQRELDRRRALAEARARGERPPLRAGGASAAAVRGPAPTGSPAPVVPEGFADAGAWSEALAFTRRVLDGSAPGAGPAESLTAHQMAAEVVRAVSALAPVAGVSVLAEAADHGIPVLGPPGASMARALLANTPRAVPGAAGSAWQVYQDEQSINEFHVPANRQKALLSVLPLALLDDFVDEEWITAVPEPDSSPRAAYLRARLAPDALSDEELSQLDWPLERERRAADSIAGPGDDWPRSWHLLHRLRRADARAVTEEWSGLPADVRKLLGELRAARRTGQVSQDLAADRSLWLLLERLAPGNRSGSRQFTGWLGVRRMLRAVRQAQLAELHGETVRAEHLRAAARECADRLDHGPQNVRWEARNVRAYLLAASDPGKALPCLELDAESRPPLLKELGQSAAHALQRNRRFLASRSRPERNGPLNPYLVLGVEDASPDWKQSWRTLRRGLDESGKVAVNQAKDAIEAAQRGKLELARFVLPLAPHRWLVPPGISRRLDLPPEPMPRRTEPPSDADRAWARQAAAREVISSAANLLSRPSGPPPAESSPS
ncbi:hypothetical protein ABT093_17290 [Kitasatospora sp. NPDC002551]|uniref:hypothetical protein n=1 Tax=Kitasatospora sp. NPDC002551 TaxID=3154539 RepID=UPI003319EB10